MTTSILALIAGLSFIGLYVIVLRRRFGVQVDVVQALLYRVDPEKLSPSDRLLEFGIRMLRNIGLFVAVVSIVGMVVGE